MSNNKQTPKEEAKEVVDAFKKLYNDTSPISDPTAKECALIFVKNILKMNSVDKDLELSDYWEEVKQEIKNYEEQ